MSEPLHSTEYMVWHFREESQFERGEKLHGMAKFYSHVADRLESQDADLATLRRKLDDALRVAGELAAALEPIMSYPISLVDGDRNLRGVWLSKSEYETAQAKVAAYRALTADGPTETKS